MSSTPLPTLTQELFSDAPIYPAFEQVKLGWSLTKLREWLGADDATVRQVLGKEAPELMAKRLIETTKMGDPAVRKALWDGGQAAIDASTDPFILQARSRSFSRLSARKNEVLPLFAGPITPRISLSFTEKFTSFRAETPP